MHHKRDKGLRITSGRLPNILVNEPTNFTSQRHLRLLAVPPYISCGGTVIYFLFHITLCTLYSLGCRLEKSLSILVQSIWWIFFLLQCVDISEVKQ